MRCRREEDVELLSPEVLHRDVLDSLFNKAPQGAGAPLVLDRQNFQGNVSAGRSWWKMIAVLGAHPSPPRSCKAFDCSPSSRLTVAPDWVS